MGIAPDEDIAFLASVFNLGPQIEEGLLAAVGTDCCHVGWIENVDTDCTSSSKVVRVLIQHV